MRLDQFSTFIDAHNRIEACRLCQEEIIFMAHAQESEVSRERANHVCKLK